MPQVQITLSPEVYKAIKQINLDEGTGNVRAFVIAAVEAEVKRRRDPALTARALTDPPPRD